MQGRNTSTDSAGRPKSMGVMLDKPDVVQTTRGATDEATGEKGAAEKMPAPGSARALADKWAKSPK